MGKMLMGEPTPMQKQDGRARRKGKAKANDEGEGSNNLLPPKMKPFWKTKKLFEVEDDFRWAMMLRLRGFWRLHWVPVQKKLMYDFL